MISKIDFLNKKIFFIILGLIPIIIWSSVASIVKFISLPNEGIYVAFYSILFGAIFSFLFTFIKDRKYIKENILLIRNNKKLLFQILLSGFFICGHYFSIYYIFSTEYVLQGNIINYLWPLFFFLMSLVFVKRDKEYKSSNLFFVFMAFVGAVSIVSGEELSTTFINKPFMLILSIFSAISASLYFILSTKIKEELNGSLMYFSLPLFVAFCLLFVIILFLPSVLSVRIEVLLLGLLLGFLSIFLANTTWIISSYHNKSHAYSSITYLVPVFSTGAVLYFNNQEYNNYLISGLILIVISNILIHFNKEVVNTVNICFAIIILYSGIVLLVPSIGERQGSSFIDIIATVFTFFAAFLLNRIWIQKKDEESILSDLYEKVDEYIILSDIENDEKKYVLSQFKEKIICRNQYFNIFFFLNTLLSQYEIKMSKNLTILSKKLHFIRASAITFPELLILILLSVISSIYVILCRDSSLIGNLMSIIFATSVTYITYIIYEFDKQGFIDGLKAMTLFENNDFEKLSKSIFDKKRVLPNILSLILLLCIIVICCFIALKFIK